MNKSKQHTAYTAVFQSIHSLSGGLEVALPKRNVEIPAKHDEI